MKFLEQSLDGNNQFWKYIIVILAAVFASQIIGAIPLMVIMIVYTIQSGNIEMVTNPANFADLSVFGIPSNLGLFLMMIPFVIGLITLIFLIKILHKRTLSETINGRKKIRWGKCLQGVIVWGSLMVVYLLIEYFSNPSNFVLQFDLLQFIPLLLISLLFIPIQATFEELTFRGYLAQGIAGWTRNRWLAFIIPGFIFGLLHLFNPEVKEFGFWIAMPQYIWFGLFFGIISVLDDGIELAMGAHAINNIFLSLFMTHKASALQTHAIFEQQMVDPVRDLIFLVVISIIAFTIFAMKYKWNFRVLNQKVAIQINHEYHEQEN